MRRGGERGVVRAREGVKAGTAARHGSEWVGKQNRSSGFEAINERQTGLIPSEPILTNHPAQ